jgi:hypothetical protein
MSSFAQRVAEQIDAEAHSGSGSWDELHGPDAVLTQVGENKYVITFPREYAEDDEDEPTGESCTVTVESVVPS